MRRPTAGKIAEKKSVQAGKFRKPRKDKGQPREKYHPNSRKNLAAPYPKGVSGNPSGLPGTDVAARIARRIFELNEARVYMAQAEQLLEGGAYNFSVLADRAYGKIKDRHEISGPDGDPINVTVKFVKPKLSDMK